ncbi:hypothetical protein DK853_36985, partial [Klebsiella oxytoca]
IAVYTFAKRTQMEIVLNLYALDCINFLLKFLLDCFFCNKTICRSTLFIICHRNKESNDILLGFF